MPRDTLLWAPARDAAINCDAFAAIRIAVSRRWAGGTKSYGTECQRFFLSHSIIHFLLLGKDSISCSETLGSARANARRDEATNSGRSRNNSINSKLPSTVSKNESFYALIQSKLASASNRVASVQLFSRKSSIIKDDDDD